MFISASILTKCTKRFNSKKLTFLKGNLDKIENSISSWTQLMHNVNNYILEQFSSHFQYRLIFAKMTAMKDIFSLKVINFKQKF